MAHREHLKDSEGNASRLWRRFVATVTAVIIIAFQLTDIYSFFSDRVAGNIDLTLLIPTEIVKIAGGLDHTLALTKDGRVYAWGDGSTYATGMDQTADSRIPTQIPALKDIFVVDIDSGYNNSYAVTGDGKIYAWGNNGSYQLGDGTNTSRRLPTLAERPTGIKFVQVSSGRYGALALTDAGDVYAWGYNAYGQCGNGGTPAYVYTPTKINGLSNIKQVSMGAYNGIALTHEGEVYTWGNDSSGGTGELGDYEYQGSDIPPGKYAQFPTPGVKIKYVHAADHHMAVISEEGRVYTWGKNSNGRVGNGAGSTNQRTPYLIAHITGAKQVAGYDNETLAVTEDGKLYVCGRNYNYQFGLGNSSNSDLTTLTLVEKLSGEHVRFATALSTVTSVIIDNDVYSAGINGQYQFGNDGTTSTSGNATHLSGKWVTPFPFHSSGLSGSG